VDPVPTAEVAAADGADDNDADGNAEADDSMVGQWEQSMGRSRKQGLKDWERRRLALVAVHQGGRFCSSIEEEKGQVGIWEGGVVPITVAKGLGTT
jgi:hypothetical protein